MSIRFAIKNTMGKAIKEGNDIVRYTGVSEPFNRHSERYCRKIGVDGAGNPKIVFTTGLDEQKVSFYNWYSEEEKEIVRNEIKELSKVVESYYGKDVIEPTNRYFWKDNRDVNRLSLKNENIDVFYDTEKPVHALLYLSIISGAFIDLVAPTKDWAIRHQVPHYLALEADTNQYEDEDGITRSDAHGALSDIRKNHGKEALYILAWCLQYDTNGYGAYTYATSEKDLVTYHVKYINGELVSKNKRNTAKQFLDYYERWLGEKTRPLLYTEAYIKAAEYYSYIVQREKKYSTLEGSLLGNTIPDAVATIMKGKMTQEYEKLREFVEKKWNE